MRKLEKYPKYKESGVEWIGEIPEEWELKKLKFLGKIYAGLTDKKGDDFSKKNEEDLKPFIPFTNIFNNVVINENEFQYVRVGENEDQNIVQKGDLLFLMSSETLEDIGKTALYDGEAEVFLNSFCKGFKVNRDKIDSYYLNWLLQSNGYRTYFSIVGRGFTRINIKQNYVNSLFTLLPPKQEQTKIAKYLDQKTAQIDKAITLKEQLIEKLKERRQVLINDAVTKGLDPNVKMKESGVEWIGEIPEEWEVLPGFNIYRENKTKNTGMIEDCQVLSLSYGKIIVKSKEKLTGLIPESFETYQVVKPGDIIIRCMDLQNDQTSLRTGIVKNNGIITSAYLNLNVINHYNSEYLHYYLHVLDITKVLYKFGTGLRQNLSYEDFKRLPVLVPSIKEQNEIVGYIEQHTEDIDQTISLQQKQIKKLKEYKATLIDSVVTGKVRVV